MRASLLAAAVGLCTGTPPGFPPSLSPGCIPAETGMTNLWCPGDGGYGCYKIPSLIRIANNTLLAFIEARKHSCDDHGFIDIRLRRSTDLGATWGKDQLIWTNSSEGGQWNTIGDGTPVWDRTTGDVHLVFMRNNLDILVTTSRDQGVSWSTPRNITHTAKPRGHKGFIGTGHAGGIQLESGRLVVPAYPTPYAIYSDDHGATWHAGQQMNEGGECQAVEIAPNTLLMNARNDQDFPVGHRYIARSTDAGSSWTPAEQNKELSSPLGGCEGSTIRHPNGNLYFSHPSRPPLRDALMVYVSTDKGKTWQHHDMAWGKAAGYSAMAVLENTADSDIGLFYDRNNQTLLIFEAKAITFQRVKV